MQRQESRLILILMHTQDCVILFADLADSVQLYASLGDEAAKARVLELQHLLESEVRSFGGNVQEIIGDELMARFNLLDRALTCSVALHRVAKQVSQQHAIQLKLRIGMHLGKVIEDHNENRLFGDTINLASRVTSIAQAGQTILTDKLFNSAPTAWQDAARLFDKTTIKGKTSPVIIYDLPWQHDDLTAITTPNDHTQTSSTASLALRHQGKKIELNECDGVFTIGRAITNNLAINAEPVSRRHVTIERVRGHFVLSDQSTNGTHLFTHTGETLFLRRQQWPMTGSGELALGASREHGTDHVVQFDCGESNTTS